MGTSPAGAPVVAAANPVPAPEAAPAASESATPPPAPVAPAAADSPAPIPDGVPAAPEAKPVPASPTGGVVIPLFREGTDSRRTMVVSIVLAALMVFGGGFAVVRALTRPSAEDVAVEKAVAAAASSPSVAAAAPVEEEPAATPAPTAVPKAPSSSEGAVHDLLALGSAPKAPDGESELAAPRRFRVLPEPGAHPDVIRWVEEARVSGVTVGNPPRALINGRLVRGGALVDPQHGIVFLGLDADRRVLVFRSSGGDVVRLEY